MIDYTATYRQTPAEMLAAEFVTAYPRAGAGRIHSTVGHAISGTPIRGALRKPTTAAAIRNGIATIAPCCKADEARLLNLYRRAEKEAGR